MTLLDVGNCVVVSQLAPPATYSGDRNGRSVDTAFYAYAVVAICCGNIGSGTMDLIVQQSSTSGGTYTTCKKLNTSDDAAHTVSSADDETVFTIAIDLNNTQRFLRVRVEPSSGVVNHVYSIALILMPYQTDTTSVDGTAASAPTFNI